MPHLRITVELDGESKGCYEFNIKDLNLYPTKATGGPIVIQFDPIADCLHQIVIDSLPTSGSKTIRGNDPTLTAN